MEPGISSVTTILVSESTHPVETTPVQTSYRDYISTDILQGQFLQKKNPLYCFLAAIAALYVTMSVGR